MDVTYRNLPDRVELDATKLAVSVVIAETDQGPLVQVETQPREVTDAVLNRCLQAFWAEVAASYPDINTGDHPFDTGDAHDIAARMAIDRWLYVNTPRVSIMLDGIEMEKA